MDLIRVVTWGYVAFLALAAALNSIPGLKDAHGQLFGIFALDIYDDAMHLASAAWAAVSAWWSRQASVAFLKLFGTLYGLDGLLGVFTGAGYLDLSILIYGPQSLPLRFKILANLPHIALGGFAAACGFVLPSQGEAH
jgi:hypothetical protein